MKDLIIGTILIIIAIMVVGYSLSQYDKRTAWYLDADGDSFGNPLQIKKAERLPKGYVSNDSDCNDGNATINQKQEAWYTRPYINNNNDESFDYNCDGIEQLRFSEYADCKKASGWQLNTLPACGETGLWLTGCEIVDGEIERIASSKKQECK